MAAVGLERNYFFIGFQFGYFGYFIYLYLGDIDRFVFFIFVRAIVDFTLNRKSLALASHALTYIGQFAKSHDVVPSSGGHFLIVPIGVRFFGSERKRREFAVGESAYVYFFAYVADQCYLVHVPKNFFVYDLFDLSFGVVSD
jgi:hypothetical protein